MLTHLSSDWFAPVNSPERPGAFVAIIVAALVGAAIWIAVFALLGLL
ncbi:MAG: hypothetical protein WBA46_06455 [Thermomicrobiales bacterium]